jgi:hypothetical protein
MYFLNWQIMPWWVFETLYILISENGGVCSMSFIAASIYLVWRYVRLGKGENRTM